MNNSQQRAQRSTTGATGRSRARRAELIALGRTLFADTSYDALSMDDIARRAGVAKGLVYYYFTNKRGYYLAVIEDAVGDLLSRATGGEDVPRAERVLRTLDGYLRYAQQNQAAYRTMVTGGVGHDTEVIAIRDRVRGQILDALAIGAWGRTSGEIPPTARLALTGWLYAVEGVTLDWLPLGDEVPRERVRQLLVRNLHDAFHAIEELEPECPAPKPDPE